MNFLGRFLRSIVTILPSALPGWLLANYAWHLICHDISCKGISTILLLTGVVLLLWSLIVFVLSLFEKEKKEDYDMWKRFRINLLSITPNILFHAALFGVMLYCCMALIIPHINAPGAGKEARLFVWVIIAVPIYELTRVFERKKSIAERPAESNDILSKYVQQPATPGWKLYGGIYLQTFLTFGIWYGVLFFLLPYTSLLTGHINDLSLVVVAIIAIVSFLLLKLFKQTEKTLRARGIVHWNSSYY